MKVGHIRRTLALAAAGVAALALWGCGGGGGSKAVTVTVSPKIAQVPLGGTQQFLASVTNGNVQVATIASNGAARSTNVVTITTTMAHGLSAGQTVVIAGVTDSSFNGTFAISTVPSTTTFTYAQTGTNATSGGGTVSAGTVKWFVNNVEGGNPASGTINTLGLYTAPSTTPPPATTVNITSTGAVRASNVVTITTTAAHNLVIGQAATISGVTDASFNGTFTIASVPSTTTFTFSQVGSNASSGNGTVTTTAVQIKAEAVADTTKSDTAQLSVESGVVVTISPASATIGVTQVFTFTAAVQNDPNNSGVTWTVQGGSSGSNGTIDSVTGLYTAPGTVPSPATFTIQAVSKLDSTKTATASVTIVTTSGAAPTLASINPTRGALGSLFQDIYLSGTDLLSTTVVKFNSQPVPSSSIFLVNQSLMRVRVPDTFLAIPGGSVIVPITVQLGNSGSPSSPVNFTIVPVRPALVESIPDSELQNNVATPIRVNGGYYGSATSPIVTAEFNGGTRTVNSVNARQLGVQLNSTDLNTPGLYSVGVRNSNASSPVAVTNFAVQPDPVSNGPTLKVKLAMPGTNPAPSAVAVDTVLGLAVVVNTGTNQVQLIDLGTLALVLGGTINVGNTPTGVAVDNQRHIALVVNSADKTVSLVDLVAKTATTPISLGAPFTSATPFSVGVNPNTGLALVAYSSTNSGSLIALAGTTSTLPCLPGGTNPATPPCLVGSVTLNTGASPQIAVEPRFNVAITTPGGAGVLSVVDLNHQNSPNAIASSGTPGAKRVSNVVTITTTAPHNIDPANPGSVLIAGVTPTGSTNFNGTFTITSIPNATTFSYSQNAADDTGGGGTVQYANPLVTFSISPSVQGISINTQTERALLADPNSSSLTILSTLDQISQPLSLTTSTNSPEFGARFTAFNPFTNIGVSVNPTTNALSVIDPVKPQRLGTPTSTGGTGSGPVAIDPGTNLAVVSNTTSNDVSIISLDGASPAMKSLHVEQVLIPAPRQLASNVTLTSPLDLSGVRILGHGFSVGTPVVCLDGVQVSGASVASDREIDVTIPHSPFLTVPRRFALEVVNAASCSGSVRSNATDFTVVEAVDVTSSGCLKPAPAAVAIALGIDASHPDLAVVADSGCNAVSLIDVTPGNPFGTFGTVTNTVALSGTVPERVATISRLGHAVVSNSGSNNASIVDLVGGKELSTVATGTQPLGVAINQDTGFAVVTNAGSNTISVFDANAGGTAGTAATDQRPIAVAIDPNRNIALVANALQGTLQVFTLSASSSATFSKSIIIGSSTIPPLPTSVVFDPASTLFLAASPLSDAFLLVNTDQGAALSVRVGINPTSLAYNYLASTLVTVNTNNNTLSTVDVQTPGTLHTTAIQGLGSTAPCPVDSNTGATLCGVDIHPLTNLVVVTDPAHNRVLLFPPAK